MSRAAKITVSLTPKQWADVLVCVRHAQNKRLGLEHVSTKLEALGAVNRDRTRRSIEKQVDACGWCGATSGFNTEYDGWDRCNECGGC